MVRVRRRQQRAARPRRRRTSWRSTSVKLLEVPLASLCLAVQLMGLVSARRTSTRLVIVLAKYACPSIIQRFAGDGVGAATRRGARVGHDTTSELECFHVFYCTAGLSWHVVGTR